MTVDAEATQLDLYLDADRGARFACPAKGRGVAELRPAGLGELPLTRCTHDKPDPKPDPRTDGQPPPGRPLPPPPDPGKHSKPDPPQDKDDKK